MMASQGFAPTLELHKFVQIARPRRLREVVPNLPRRKKKVAHFLDIAIQTG